MKHVANMYMFRKKHFLGVRKCAIGDKKLFLNSDAV